MPWNEQTATTPTSSNTAVGRGRTSGAVGSLISFSERNEVGRPEAAGFCRGRPKGQARSLGVTHAVVRRTRRHVRPVQGRAAGPLPGLGERPAGRGGGRRRRMAEGPPAG